MKDKIISFCFLVGLVAVLCVFIYPHFMDALQSIEQITSLHAYDDGLDSMDDVKIDAAIEAAVRYNAEIALKQSKKSFFYAGEAATDATYESLLNPGGDGVIGTVDIPTAGIYLPITHGTDSEDLLTEAGHLYGTSLPCGGVSTHAVIAGHTGLQNADLFTNLPNVSEGDRFYLHVMGKTLTYQVDNIAVVLPEDEDPYLQIEAGKDMVTLYTCTPYGINSHRLLVRGVREDVGQEGTSIVSGGKAPITHVSYDGRAIRKCVLWGMPPVMVLVIGTVLILRKKKAVPERA